MPGDSREKIRKAAALGVDSVIMDLEDGVAHSRKAAARASVLEALTTVDFGAAERLVRINPVGSGLEAEDIAATLPGRPDGYVIPKVESPDQVRWASREIRNRLHASGAPGPGHVPLLVLIETARGVMYLREIAESDPNVVALIFGSEDFAGNIGATRTAEGVEVLYARSAVVVAAVAHDLQPIDTVFMDLEDMDGLARDAKLGATLGYQGKLAIHPKQLKTIEEAFTPGPEAVRQAQRVVQAFREQQAGGRGAFVLDGKMVDTPVVRAAEGVLARARAAGKIADG